jgi:magnesium-transporting ATPase (P-type)
MTGESFPVEKQPEVISADAAPSGPTSWFRGVVRSGTGEGPRRRNGRRTAFGAIARHGCAPGA